MNCHPQSQVFPHVCVDLPVFQFMLTAPCFVAEHHRKGPGSIHLTPICEIFVSIDGIPQQSSPGGTNPDLSESFSSSEMRMSKG